MADIIQMNENTWRIEDGFVRFFLLVGREKAALIDSGMNCPNAAELAKTLTDLPLILMNTHGDGDHVSGTGAFSEIFMHESDYVNCGVGARFRQTALQALEDGDVIDLGDRPICVVHIPGHTYGSLAFLDTNNRTLIAGDSVQKGHIYMFGDKRDTASYEESLDKLISLSNAYDQILASHDEPVLPGDYAKKVKAAWNMVKMGETAWEPIDLFGNPVKSYTTEYCGFYLS